MVCAGLSRHTNAYSVSVVSIGVFAAADVGSSGAVGEESTSTSVSLSVGSRPYVRGVLRRPVSRHASIEG
jgi:hypothetical protein